MPRKRQERQSRTDRADRRIVDRQEIRHRLVGHMQRDDHGHRHPGETESPGWIVSLGIHGFILRGSIANPYCSKSSRISPTVCTQGLQVLFRRSLAL